MQGWYALIVMLERITHENLQDIALSTRAQTMMFSRNYYDSIDLYDIVIRNTVSFVEKLVSELNQAYCFWRLIESGATDLPTHIRWQPTTFDEYLDILNLVIQLISEGGFEIEESKPESVEFAMDNHPNPFNPETNINFTIGSDVNVKLNIYNIRGQLVKTLVNENFKAGNHSILWNGTDFNNNQVSSGIYFYRLEAGSNSVTQKMLLMK